MNRPYQEPNDCGQDADRHSDQLFAEPYDHDIDDSIAASFGIIAKEMDELAAKRAEPVPENLFAKAWRLNAMNEADAELRRGLRSSYKLEAAFKGLPIPSDAEVDAMIDRDNKGGILDVRV